MRVANTTKRLWKETSRPSGLSVDFAVGSVGTFFTFDASASSDKETENSKLLVRWDFDGDGVWDTSYSLVKVVSIQFMNVGTFSVSVEARDERGWLAMTKRQIRIENQNPFTPSALSVANDAADQPITLTLDWFGGDPDAFDTVTYDVYFGTSVNPPLGASDLSATSFALAPLNYNTFYFLTGSVLVIDYSCCPGRLWAWLAS